VTSLELPQKPKTAHVSTILLVIIVVVSLIAGGFLGYSIVSRQINDLQNQVSALQRQILSLQSANNTTNQNIVYVLGKNASLSQLYEQIKDSVVVIRGLIVQYDFFQRAYYAQVQGSGFVYNFTGEMVILTNYHVVSGAVNITVTFADGNGYTASVLGSDLYADLAVLSTDAPHGEYSPLEIARSSTLKVGDPVITVGNPYGLAGSMTTGIVSATGRTITEETSSYAIADVIQTTALLNPGNSGGPLLNYEGQVIGVTTATVSGSQGLGFAIPSDTILREIKSLVTKGSYSQHPWLGVAGTDMTYEIAKSTNVNTTYGCLLAEVMSGGPADKAGLHGGAKQVQIAGGYVTVGGDVIIALNGTKIKSMDELSTYLETRTLPGETINVTIVRNNQTITLPVVLGTRPLPS
jgi:S1-C subfamily serine protease